MSRANMDIDWLACELIEQITDKVSGRPIARGPEFYPMLRLIEFAHAMRRQPVS